MSLLLLSGMSMGASTVLRLSGSAWNWLRVVALPSWTLFVLDTLKLEVRLLMNVVLPRPLSPVCSRAGVVVEGEEGGGKERDRQGQGSRERGGTAGAGGCSRGANKCVCLLIV